MHHRPMDTFNKTNSKRDEIFSYFMYTFQPILWLKANRWKNPPQWFPKELQILPSSNYTKLELQFNVIFTEDKSNINFKNSSEIEKGINQICMKLEGSCKNNAIANIGEQTITNSKKEKKRKCIERKKKGDLKGYITPTARQLEFIERGREEIGKIWTKCEAAEQKEKGWTSVFK